MALDIFDLEDAPQPRTQFTNDLVGAIKGGYAINGRPVASTTVVLTTDDPSVAESFVSHFGGEIEELDVDKGDDRRVVTEATSVDLIVDDADALKSRFVLFGRSGLIYATDGRTITEGEGLGEPFERPSSFREWKDKARKDLAPSPEITLKAKLAADPELGYLRYRTSSWTLLPDLPQVEADLVRHAEHGPVSVTLKLELVSYTAKNGPRKGSLVEYTRPVLVVNGPAK